MFCLIKVFDFKIKICYNRVLFPGGDEKCTLTNRSDKGGGRVRNTQSRSKR